ncbi:MAG: pentapeptide repeat-containing protein [Candidatus Methanofastidiosia archaeon]
MKCTYTYDHGKKECPHEAQDNKTVCLWHDKIDGKDLRGKDLRKLDLDEAYLKGAALSKTNMKGCMLANANLEEANLDEANLEGVMAHACNLTKAQMRNANLEGAHLKYAIMEGTIVANSNLKNADLSWTELKGALLPGAQLQYASLLDSNLEQAILLHASLERANMRGADLRGADLKGCNFRGADMRGTDFKYAILDGAILSNGNLQNADFAKAQLKGTLIQNAFLQRANFRESEMGNANLKNSNLKGANLRGANLKGANFDNTILKNADLFNAKVNGMMNLRYALIDNIVITEKKGNEDLKNSKYISALKRYDEAIKSYIDLKNYFNSEGLYEKSGEYYVREWIVKGKVQRTAGLLDKEHLKTNRFMPYYLPISFKYMESRMFPLLVAIESRMKWIFNKIVYHTSRYGESSIRVLLSSLAIIFLYAAFYWTSHGITPGVDSYVPTFSESIYFSVVTFTTLGYGDYHPKPSFQLIATSEAIIGAFILAFFVVVVSRRLIR